MMSADNSKPATRADLEESIVAARMRLKRPVDGIFGPESVSWRIDRESALFLGAGRAALLQLAHPWVAAALDQHSSLLAKPIARFHNTFRVVFTIVFGTAEQAFRAARAVFVLHSRIKGKLEENLAGHSIGTRYDALEMRALLWVFATLIESAVTAYEFVLPALAVPERESYYAESKLLAGLFGLPAEVLPATWSSFETYFAGMLESEVLEVGAKARKIGQGLLTGAGTWIPIPGWYRALTAGWLPPRLASGFGLENRNANQGRPARESRAWLRRVYQHLPAGLRYVGPYQEATARLKGESPGFWERRSNLFWIGQPLMPFSATHFPDAIHEVGDNTQVDKQYQDFHQ